MRVAVDLEGGDSSPTPHVKGALAALDERDDVSVTLVGARIHQQKIERLIARSRHPGRIRALFAVDIVPMRAGREEEVRRWTHTRTTTMFQAVQTVESGNADAVLTTGNTGVFGGVALRLGRKERRRPGLLITLPTPRGNVLVTDVGYDNDPQPKHLVDYARGAIDIAPSLIGEYSAYNIATLNIGHEPEKGLPIALEARKLLLEAGLPWLGHVEPRDIHEGSIPCPEGSDAGSFPLHIAIGAGPHLNIWLKTLSATPKLYGWAIRRAIKSPPWWTMPWKMAQAAAGFVLRPTMRRARSEMQSTMGAAIVTNLERPAFKAHGASKADDIFHAVLIADNAARLAMKS